MLTSKFSRVGLSCAFAALLVVAAPGVHSSWAVQTPASVQLLNSHLPEGVALRNTDAAQVYEAVKGAVADRPDLAVNVLKAAIMAKSQKNIRHPLDCAMLVKIVDAASTSAPTRTRELAETALALDPECSSELDTYLASVGLNGAGSLVGDVGEGGIGAGFGPGFPGSPGFVGSAPGGTIALPPVGVAVTSVTNR